MDGSAAPDDGDGLIAEAVSTVELGRRIEDQVAERLAAQGWRILERRFYRRAGEIDLICEEPRGAGCVLVFVEVRHRAPGAMVSALESVGLVKQRRLKRTAQMYLLRYRGRAQEMRIDVVAMDGDVVTHVRNAVSV